MKNLSGGVIPGHNLAIFEPCIHFSRVHVHAPDWNIFTRLIQIILDLPSLRRDDADILVDTSYENFACIRDFITYWFVDKVA